MAELDEQIRSIIDGGAAPVTLEEIFATRLEIKTRRTRRHSRGSRQLIAAGVAVALIAAISVGVTFLPTNTSLTNSKASAAEFLDAAASVAQHQKALVPGPGHYLYVATLNSMTAGQTTSPSPKMYFYYVNLLVQTWSAPGKKGNQQWSGVGRPEFVSKSDYQTWVLDGAKAIERGSGSGNSSPYYDVTDLPTKASAMPDFFKSQRYLGLDPTNAPNADWEFSSALAFLENGASSSQRAALLRFLATLHGVRLMGEATSVATEKKGTLIGLPSDMPGITQEAIFNSSTSELIETRSVITAPSKLPEFMKEQVHPIYRTGEVLSYSDYLFDGVSSLNQSPPKSPALPVVWPSGTTKMPLTIVLNPKTGQIISLKYSKR